MAGGAVDACAKCSMKGGVSNRAAFSDEVELSIGTLSSATGVPVETLRTWERRYGFPVPVTRTEGSHRRYLGGTVAVVHLIVKALGQGHRPSSVVGRTPDEIRRLIALGGGAVAREELAPEDRATIDRWLELTLALDAESFASALEQRLATLSVIDFLEQYLGPFLTEVGERWARRKLRITHEHFASEQTREFLNAHWRRLAEGTGASARTIVLATPVGEHHVLGLHMAAWVGALAGSRIVFLGANTPMAELAFAAERHGAHGVALSVAQGYTGDLSAQLGELRGKLPRGVKVAVGGAGALSAEVPAAHKLNRFGDLVSWTRALGRPRRGHP